MRRTPNNEDWAHLDPFSSGMADGVRACTTSCDSVLAERGGTQLKTPRPVILVDTREQSPFDFSRFEGWFAGIEKKPLKLGDYSVAGLEDVCVVERKDLPDLIHSLTADRSVFVNRLRRMSRYPYRLLVITAAVSQVKSPYPHGHKPEPHYPVVDCGTQLSQLPFGLAVWLGTLPRQERTSTCACRTKY